MTRDKSNWRIGAQEVAQQQLMPGGENKSQYDAHRPVTSYITWMSTVQPAS